MMPSVAAWLLARPQNAVFALAITMLLPILPTIGGAILMLVALQQDLRRAIVVAAAAGAALVVVALVSGASLLQALIQLGSLWIPTLGLAAAMRTTRSLILTMQLSVIVVLVGTCLFFVLTSDPVGFWQQVIAAEPVLQALQLQEWQSAVGATDEQFAGVMTTMFAIGFWFGLIGVLLLGYWLYLQVPGNTPRFGLFSDLNFGRVIASLLAVTSVIGFAVDAVWIQSIAFLLFAVFWLQGVAMVHWLHRKGHIPLFAVSAAYILTLFVAQYAGTALAVLGYTDAWFQYRNRVTKQQ
jgi:hypothetical protein